MAEFYCKTASKRDSTTQTEVSFKKTQQQETSEHRISMSGDSADIKPVLTVGGELITRKESCKRQALLRLVPNLAGRCMLEQKHINMLISDQDSECSFY